LAEPTAKALAKVQARLKAANKSLIVYDCYRPARAARRFAAWAKAGGRVFDPQYYPRIPRNRLIALGYIARVSAHSSGGVVDLTFGAADGSDKITEADMGGGFDLFDASSHTRSKEVSAIAQANRAFLREAMGASGFVNYAREWWHYRYAREPFSGQQFDFPVVPAKAPD
jgi:D-alanyl-D-alanine dipeptidase